MKFSYHDGYGIALPAAHPFPVSKSLLLRNRLMADGLLSARDVLEPEPIDIETAALVHTRAYLDKLQSSSLSAAELRRLGLPWSRELWRRSRLAVGGTLLAARAALAGGLAGLMVASRASRTSSRSLR